MLVGSCTPFLYTSPFLFIKTCFQSKMEKKALKCTPFEPPLSREETAKACEVLIKKMEAIPEDTHKKVIRSEADPAITNQELGLISFRLFPKPFVTKRGSNVFGLVKIRGNFPNEDQCNMKSSEIIRKVSSVDTIMVVPVGRWVPITEDNSFAKEKFDVAQDDEGITLRGFSQKEEMEKKKGVAKELEEKVRLLKERGDLHDDPESINYYTMKRVVELNLRDELKRKQKLIQEIKKKHERIISELVILEKKYPEYSDGWVVNYNMERESVGLPPFIHLEEDKEEYSHLTEGSLSP